MRSRGRDLDLYQEMVETDLTHLAHNCRKKPMINILSVAEHAALKDLESDASIVIRNQFK